MNVKSADIDDRISDLYREVVGELLAVPGVRLRRMDPELPELENIPRGYRWYGVSVVFAYDGIRYELAQRRGDTPGGWQIKLERQDYPAVYLKPPCSLRDAAQKLAVGLSVASHLCSDFAAQVEALPSNFLALDEGAEGADEPTWTRCSQMEDRGKPYRKKPIVIRAFQCAEPQKVHTLEGVMAANPGDWIIEGVKGELYPCRDDIFRATYDEVGACE